VPMVALVGYTNAGKSTLFNALTAADVYVEDQMFATLDPTMRQLYLPELGTVVLSDTVGFMRDLPPPLIAAFHATLEALKGADLLLHVVDVSHAFRKDCMASVQEVLTAIGADQVPQLLVHNKIDRCENLLHKIDRNAAGMPVRVCLSAHDDQGQAMLLQAIAERLGQGMIECECCLLSGQGKLYAQLQTLGAMVAEGTDQSGLFYQRLRIQRHDYERLFMVKL
jgi:GTPase